MNRLVCLVKSYLSSHPRTERQFELCKWPNFLFARARLAMSAWGNITEHDKKVFGIFRWLWKEPLLSAGCSKLDSLTSESVQSTALPLQSVDHIHGGDSLPLGMLSVGDCVTDHILQEDLQHTPGLFIDQSRDTLHTTSAGQTSDCWLGNTLDIVSQDFPVPLCTTLSKTFASFSSAWHVYWSVSKSEMNSDCLCPVYIGTFRASGQGSTEISSLWAPPLHISTSIFRASGQDTRFRTSMQDTASDSLVTWPQTAFNVKGKFGSHQSAQKFKLWWLVWLVWWILLSQPGIIISNSPNQWDVTFNSVSNL